MIKILFVSVYLNLVEHLKSYTRQASTGEPADMVIIERHGRLC
jgi:hypothetical protein